MKGETEDFTTVWCSVRTFGGLDPKGEDFWSQKLNFYLKFTLVEHFKFCTENFS